MKKSWVIAMLSIIPGLGFIALGKAGIGLGVFALVAILALLAGNAPTEDLSTTGFTVALIAWITQWYYAIKMAKEQAQVGAGVTQPVWQGSPNLPRAQAAIEDIQSSKARQTMQPLLEPGEDLQVVLYGSKRLPVSKILSEVLYALLTRVYLDRADSKIYLGLTERVLILIQFDQFGKPDTLQRFPLNRVRLISSSQGWLSDKVLIQFGEARPLQITIDASMRERTHQLVAILSGKEGDLSRVKEISAWEQRGSLKSGGLRTVSLRNFGQSQPTDHPVLVSTLLGAVGGIAGAAAGVILSIILGALLIGLFSGAPSADDTAEGLGYLVGFYCLLMFPCGGALVGAVPGILLGIFRFAQDRMLTPIRPLLAGFLTVVILTIAGLILLVNLP
jgi:hypothetical protein